MFRAWILFHITFISFFSNAECSLEGSFVDSVIELRDTLQNIRSFKAEPEEIQTYQISGIAETFELNPKFYALKLSEKVPNLGSLKTFILGWDISSENFYIYHNNGVQEPSQKLFIGKRSIKRCAINFQVSPFEEIDITFLTGEQIELISLKRDQAHEQLHIEQHYIFSTLPYAN